MRKTALCLPFLLLAAGAAHSQDVQGQGACPRLPADAGLSWEHLSTGDADICRALREDGSEAFGLYIAADSPFQPNRRNREEEGSVAGQDVLWYRAELANNPDIEARETLIELDDGRVAHVWLQAQSGDQLQQVFGITRDLRFGASSLLETQIAAGQ